MSPTLTTKLQPGTQAPDFTLPDAEGKRPLVVMPHGGPIGVSDDRHFNRDVQFIASLGYAVLQVNYRGSDGYGKAFREAGYRNYGKLIEDDIDAAIKAALAAYPLDESKMCALGGSYGGYSAMVAAIRWPERFRCAVSIAGVSDRALFFTASDSGRDAQTRLQMERIMGNPNVPADLADMQLTSPLYRYQDLKVPVMLVHGQEDVRVDMEHTRRLVRLLNLAGRPPVLMSLANEGHGFEKLDSVDKSWTAIAGFLQEYLGATKGAVANAPANPVPPPANP
jgi:dipeptidyl aminopeptidase/acylaminoacyl peptidase